jgi:hypothetical protein
MEQHVILIAVDYRGRHWQGTTIHPTIYVNMQQFNEQKCICESFRKVEITNILYNWVFPLVE